MTRPRPIKDHRWLPGDVGMVHTTPRCRMSGVFAYAQPTTDSPVAGGEVYVNDGELAIVLDVISHPEYSEVMVLFSSSCRVGWLDTFWFAPVGS